MKEQIALMLGIGAIIILLVLTSCELIACKVKLKKYEKYYKCSEKLLDHLEIDLNWIDRTDGQIVDEYYDAREKLIKQLQE